MYYSYVMGIKDIKLSEEFKIQKEGEDYLVAFPSEKANEFEDFIAQNLPIGFWNEYVGEKIVFLFKFSDGTIHKYILNNENHDEILALCSVFASTTFTSIKDMILDNEFYKKVIKWN